MAFVGALRTCGAPVPLTWVLGELFERMMEEKIDSRGYIFAPLTAPTLHIVFTPLWALMGGNPSSAVLAMAWQVIAWFGLMAVCLATYSPALWLMRKHIANWPFPAATRRHKLIMGVVASVLSSMFLIGPVAVRFVLGAWLAGLLASACVMSALFAHASDRSTV